MALFKTATAKAEADIAELVVARGKLDGAVMEAEGELAALRAGPTEEAALDAFLQDSPATGHARELTIERKLADLKGARKALVRRTQEAVKARAKAEAEVIRAEAKQKQKALTEYANERAARLQALESFTGCRWQVDITPDVTLIGAGGLETRTGRNKPADRGLALSREIDLLIRQADAIEARAADQTAGGAVPGWNLQELLTAVGDNPAAPTRNAIEAWFQEADSRAAAEWSRAYLDGKFVAAGPRGANLVTAVTRQTSFTLVWDSEGNIDRAKSRFVNSLAPAPLQATA